MRIGIIGAGASGLTAYLFLVKHLPQPPAPSPPHELVIFESHELSKRKKGEGSYEVPLVGAGVGIAANGMNVLYELDKDLHDEIQQKGFAGPKIGFRNGRGWNLGSANAMRDYGNHVEALVMISREDVLDCLLRRIPEGVIKQKSVAKVSEEKGEQQVTIEFEDGSSEAFDLVIGADGVWSKARHAVLGDEHRPYYTGLFGVGGFVPSSLLDQTLSSGEGTAPAQIIMTFSGNGFFGYGPSTSGTSPVTEAQLRGKEPLKPGQQAVWWSSFERDNPDTRSVDVSEMRKGLVERHKDWSDPVIQQIIQEPDLNIRSVATWVMPKASTWVSDRIVLVGDAAHALPSTSGQGISQAMLDSQALALLLTHHIKRTFENQQVSEGDALRTALQQYVKIRKAPVEDILDAANKMGDQKKKSTGVVQEMAMYAFLKILFTFFGDSMTRDIFKYDIREEVRKVTRWS